MEVAADDITAYLYPVRLPVLTPRPARAPDGEEAMPSLRNARYEKFVQGLLEGKSATDAHEEAGYARDDGNASTQLRVSGGVLDVGMAF